jgi:hypothetical protein
MYSTASMQPVMIVTGVHISKETNPRAAICNGADIKVKPKLVHYARNGLLRVAIGRSEVNA